jgi:hypothetical protein
VSGADDARLTEYRALRDAAWAMVQADVDALKADLAAQGIGARLKEKAAEEAQDAWDTARDVAAEHKGVVAGTLLAVVAWLLRGPIGSALALLFDDDGDDEDDDQEQPSA